MKKFFAIFVTAALLCACGSVEEETSRPIYYIEAPESADETVPAVSGTNAAPDAGTVSIVTSSGSSAETADTALRGGETAVGNSETAVTGIGTTRTANVNTGGMRLVTETVSGTTAGPELYQGSYTADDGVVKVMGRTFMKDGVRILSHSCSGVEFGFRGTSADVTLTSNCETSKARVNFYVNGVLHSTVTLENEEETFHLFDSGTPRNCIISVVKITEAAYSNVGVKRIDVTSEYGVIPTPEKSRKIEFIGDSVTCGYGVDAADQYEKFSTSNENGVKSYAAITAKNLNADYSVIAWSGIGVYSSYTESSAPNQSYLMPDLYGKTAPDELSGDMWDFSQWQPDVVVINLGTNDNTWTNGVAERVDSFGEAYYDFIAQVRKANPDAYIICSLGVLGSQLLPEIREQAALYSQNTGDNRVAVFEFDYQDGQADGYGSGYHPSAATHQKMADKLTPFIKELMGWD